MTRKKDPESLRPYCGAKVRTRVGTCRNRAVQGSTRCRMHGGTGDKGLAAPQTTAGGKWSEHLPDISLKEKYERLTRDSGRVSLMEDIRLADAMIADALSNLGEGSLVTSKTLQAIDHAYHEFAVFNRAGNKTKAQEWWQRLGVLIEQAMTERQAREDVVRITEHKRKLTDTELKLEVASRTMLSAEESNALTRALAEAVNDVVTDPQVRRKIAARLSDILNVPNYGGSS